MEETSKFQRRFEEGYDVPDARYEHWLEVYHPEAKLSNEGSGYNPLSQASVSSDSSTQQHCRVNPPHTSLSRFLRSSTPKYKFPQLEPKNSARILTSAESLRILEEKQRKKQEEVAKKEERKAAREKAKVMKAIEAQRKQLGKHKKNNEWGFSIVRYPLRYQLDITIECV